MNAVNRLVPFGLPEISLTGMISDLTSTEGAAEVHERLRLITALVSDIRGQLARLRADLEHVSLSQIPTDQLDDYVTEFTREIQLTTANRKLADQLVKSLRHKLRRSGRRYLLAALDRAANTADLCAAERIEVFRTARSKAFREFSMRDHEPSGPVFDSPEALRAHLLQELTL
jgi:hypothetical protein